MENFKELVIEKKLVVLTNKDESDYYQISYDDETEKFTLKHLDKTIKTVKKFNTIHNYFVDLNKKIEEAKGEPKEEEPKSE